MTLNTPKIKLIAEPTPLEFLPTISNDLGINLFIKRDDMTSIGMGGNKLRKLEYFIYDAKMKGATMLLTVGGAQTNHGRLTAAVAAKFGMKCAIVAVDEYPGELSANLLLDALMNCHVYLAKPDSSLTSKEKLEKTVADVTAEWEEKGENIYFVPMGGSNELGALGYFDCLKEIESQLKKQNIKNARVVTTVGSMGTYMGLNLGIAASKMDLSLTGISVLPQKEDHKELLDRYFSNIKKSFSVDFNISKDSYDVHTEYECGGYNNPVKEIRETIKYVASSEGLFFDPCYTGKAFTGLIDMVKKGSIPQGENVVFIHTGGFPGIYTKHHRSIMESELKDFIHII